MNIENIKARCIAAICNYTGTTQTVEFVGVGNGVLIAKTQTHQFEFNHLTGGLKLHVWSFI